MAEGWHLHENHDDDSGRNDDLVHGYEAHEFLVTRQDRIEQFA